MATHITVEPLSRSVVLTLTPDEAKLLRDWMQTSTEPPYAGKLLYGAVSAIADLREYGGH